MRYTATDIANILECSTHISKPDMCIAHLSTDSRRISFADKTLFFAIETTNRDGHAFIDECYTKGVRNFVVKTTHTIGKAYYDANFYCVNNTLDALQQLAKYHRAQFHYPVIGITGSNGKTIVKEWLYQLLSTKYKIVKTPRSYNSQVGVPLSIWEMNNEYNLAIFEAGISQKHEMIKLQKIIQPDMGVFTNIGAAHSKNFNSNKEKLDEKFKLFTDVQKLFISVDDVLLKDKIATDTSISYFTVGKDARATFSITAIQIKKKHTILTCIYAQKQYTFTLGFTDVASIDNCCMCIAICLYHQLSYKCLQQQLLKLRPVEMRLQVMPGINGCTFINDSYSLDLQSLSIALDFLFTQPNKKTLILSDFTDATEDTYSKALDLLQHKQLHQCILIGPAWKQMHDIVVKVLPNAIFFTSTQTFIQHFNALLFTHQTILIKGARKFGFENFVPLLQQKTHTTYLEINLQALLYNLKVYKQHLQSSTKIMVMVKAFGYGSGSLEIASLLQYHKIDYLTVAYTDEAVELKNAGISLPIMVMNIDTFAIEKIITYGLEPEIFSFSILETFINQVKTSGLHQYPIHIKIDTGMHRLGFSKADVPKLAAILKNNDQVCVKSVFSHLAASEDALENSFTQQQACALVACCTILQEALGYPFLRHISNSAGIMFHPDLQMDMVRLGIGLYGIGIDLDLQPVITLKTTIAQIREIAIGETIGYNRKGILYRNSKIATLRIGYADGFKRYLSNGVGKVFIKNRLAPVVGMVCMDMTMIDVTDIEDIKEEDEVEIFGPNLPVTDVAKWCNTNVYEILTGIGQRVKRIYTEE